MVQKVMEHFEETERLATPEEREELVRVLGSYGLYDASLDHYPTVSHIDEQWA